ncbi:putative sda1 domain protein, partial [Golovinomyces cichoracearum]
SVKEWFADLYKTVGEFEIDNGKKILNVDECGARVGCPTGETVIVPIEVKELYTASPENRKSVTIIETIRGDGKKTLPPYIIAPGKKIMDNWIASELVVDEGIDCSPTGYNNNDFIMKYADHLIKYSHAGRNKPWKLLLLDGHESHRYDPFVLKLAENHIKAFWFPSHLTHIL